MQDGNGGNRGGRESSRLETDGEGERRGWRQKRREERSVSPKKIGREKTTVRRVLSCWKDGSWRWKCDVGESGPLRVLLSGSVVLMQCRRSRRRAMGGERETPGGR
jgi:hypothetical protein